MQSRETAAPPVVPPSPPNGSGRPARPRVLRRLLWLGAQLFVVFAGVYGAALLQDRREARADAVREAQALQAIQEFYSRISEDFEQNAPFFIAIVDSFETRYRRSERPPLTPITFTAGADFMMWQSLLASSGDVLDAELVADIEMYNGYFRSTLDGALRLRALSDRYLIPNASADPSTFYLPNGRLRPEYAWYLEGLQRIRSGMSYATGNIDSVLVRLDAALQATDID